MTFLLTLPMTVHISHVPTLNDVNITVTGRNMVWKHICGPQEVQLFSFFCVKQSPKDATSRFWVAQKLKRREIWNRAVELVTTKVFTVSGNGLMTYKKLEISRAPLLPNHPRSDQFDQRCVSPAIENHRANKRISFLKIDRQFCFLCLCKEVFFFTNLI